MLLFCFLFQVGKRVRSFYNDFSLCFIVVLTHAFSLEKVEGGVTDQGPFLFYFCSDFNFCCPVVLSVLPQGLVGCLQLGQMLNATVG